MAAAPVAIDLILAPVDGSEASLDAVDYAVAIAAKYDAGVHLLYVLEESEVHAIDAGTVESEALVERQEAFLEAATAVAEERSVPTQTSSAYGFSTHRKSRHPGSVILDATEEIGADFIVVPREPATDAPDILEKSAEYVLLYASQPVLSV